MLDLLTTCRKFEFRLFKICASLGKVCGRCSCTTKLSKGLTFVEIVSVLLSQIVEALSLMSEKSIRRSL